MARARSGSERANTLHLGTELDGANHGPVGLDQRLTVERLLGILVRVHGLRPGDGGQPLEAGEQLSGPPVKFVVVPVEQQPQPEPDLLQGVVVPDPSQQMFEDRPGLLRIVADPVLPEIEGARLRRRRRHTFPMLAQLFQIERCQFLRGHG